VYADSTSEYFGLVTPEWLDDLEIYKQHWVKETNQIPKYSEPLFKKSGPFVKRLSPPSIRTRMSRVVDESGVRVYIEGTKNKFNIPLFNGARRFFNKQNKKALTKTSKLAALIIKEYQMGHGGLIKLDKNYFKEQIDELIDEYLQTIPYVTIDKTARKQAELEKQNKKISDLEEKTGKIEDLENTIQVMQNNIKNKDNEWNETIVKLFEEQAKKFTDPDYIKGLQEKEKL
jgi:hypothetical protein